MVLLAELHGLEFGGTGIRGSWPRRSRGLGVGAPAVGPGNVAVVEVTVAEAAVEDARTRRSESTLQGVVMALALAPVLVVERARPRRAGGESAEGAQVAGVGQVAVADEARPACFLPEAWCREDLRWRGRSVVARLQVRSATTTSAKP